MSMVKPPMQAPHRNASGRPAHNCVVALVTLMTTAPVVSTVATEFAASSASGMMASGVKQSLHDRL